MSVRTNNTDAVVVIFRGRSTAGIVSDARRAGIVHDGCEQVIVAREGDELAQPGDLTPAAAIERLTAVARQHRNVTIIANGGTSAQLVPVLAHVVTSSESWRAIDLQREGHPVVLAEAHQVSSELCACGCGEPGIFSLADYGCARRMSW